MRAYAPTPKDTAPTQANIHTAAGADPAWSGRAQPDCRRARCRALSATVRTALLAALLVFLVGGRAPRARATLFSGTFEPDKYFQSIGKFIQCGSNAEYDYEFKYGSSEDIEVLSLGMYTRTTYLELSDGKEPLPCSTLLSRLNNERIITIFPNQQLSGTWSPTITDPKSDFVLLVALDCNSNLPFTNLEYTVRARNPGPQWRQNLSCNWAPVFWIAIASSVVGVVLLAVQAWNCVRLWQQGLFTRFALLMTLRLVLLVAGVLLITLYLALWSARNVNILPLRFTGMALILLALVVQLGVLLYLAIDWQMPTYSARGFALSVAILFEMLGMLGLGVGAILLSSARTTGNPYNSLLGGLLVLWLLQVLMVVGVTYTLRRPCLRVYSPKLPLTLFIVLFVPLPLWISAGVIGLLVPDDMSVGFLAGAAALIEFFTAAALVWLLRDGRLPRAMPPPYNMSGNDREVFENEMLSPRVQLLRTVTLDGARQHHESSRQDKVLDPAGQLARPSHQSSLQLSASLIGPGGNNPLPSGMLPGSLQQQQPSMAQIVTSSMTRSYDLSHLRKADRPHKRGPWLGVTQGRHQHSMQRLGVGPSKLLKGQVVFPMRHPPEIQMTAPSPVGLGSLPPSGGAEPFTTTSDASGGDPEHMEPDKARPHTPTES